MSFDVRSVRGEPQISNRFGAAMICGLVSLTNAEGLRKRNHLGTSTMLQLRGGGLSPPVRG